MTTSRFQNLMRCAILTVLPLSSCSGPHEEHLHPQTIDMSYAAPSNSGMISLDYTEVHDDWANQDVLNKASRHNVRVVISRGSQRGRLMVGDEVGMDFPVCTGMASHQTPLGHFRIREKAVHHVSNIYDAPMPYFMRLTDGGIGLHVGPIFREPQSHGCIRIPRSSCAPLFNLVKVGTPVTIER